MTAPASLSFITVSASSSGILFVKNLEPAVVRTPAVSNRSFSAIGMPSSDRSFRLDGWRGKKCVRLKGRLNRQFGRGRDKGVDQRIEPLDLAKACLGEFERREISASKCLHGGGNGQRGGIDVH